jgi:hypothetical protein
VRRLQGTATETQAQAATKKYVLHVTLRDGEELTANVGPQEAARDGLAVLHATLATEPFAVIGEDTIVRSEDVRFVQLREESDDTDGRGLLGTMRAKIIGEGGDMSSYNTEETEVRTSTGARRMAPERRGDGRGWADDWVGYGRRPWAETKPFFMTSEFLGAAAMIAAVLIAAAVDDALDASRAWLLATIVAAAYIVSRGLAKSGTRDPNPQSPGRDY